MLKNKDRPAVLNVNIGTTVKGAVNDLDNSEMEGGVKMEAFLQFV